MWIKNAGSCWDIAVASVHFSRSWTIESSADGIGKPAGNIWGFLALGRLTQFLRAFKQSQGLLPMLIQQTSQTMSQLLQSYPA